MVRHFQTLRRQTINNIFPSETWHLLYYFVFKVLQQYCSDQRCLKLINKKLSARPVVLPSFHDLVVRVAVNASTCYDSELDGVSTLMHSSETLYDLLGFFLARTSSNTNTAKDEYVFYTVHGRQKVDASATNKPQETTDTMILVLH